jgi:hypothetical protein
MHGAKGFYGQNHQSERPCKHVTLDTRHETPGTVARQSAPFLPRNKSVSPGANPTPE